MQTEILLKQIQQHITQLRKNLEEFESALQPDSVVSDKLNSELHDLGKLVGAYSFIRQQQELSPRLDLHIKVSEKLQESSEKISPEKQETPAPPVQAPPVQKPAEPVHHATSERTEAEHAQNYPKINVSINDKFRFINELFKSNAVEYGIAIEQINAIGNWHDTHVYLNGLKNIYGWEEEDEMVRKMFSLARKRF